MIYLITGTPGTGKTSLLVKMMLDNTNKMFTFEDGTPRPLYFNHIQGLDAKKFKAHELKDDELIAAPLQEVVPEGSVVIVDECDYIYPLRGVKAPPPYVQTLKELRHHGFTLILLTQSPMMFDSYVRRLVATHWHLVRRPLGTKLYEFNGAQENLGEANLKLAPWKYYKPDKRTFNLYKSASVHIKHKKKLHWAFYAFPLIIIAAIFFIKKALTPALDSIEAAQNNETVVASGEQVETVASKELGIAKSASAVGIKATDYVARLPDHPETAPLYDGLRKPVNMELVVGCVKSATGCNCYTEQATLVPVSKTYCESFVEHGKFDAYRKRVDRAQSGAIQPSETEIKKQ